MQKHLQVVGPVPGEPVWHGVSTAVLWARSGLPLLGPSPLLHGENSEGSYEDKVWPIFAVCGIELYWNWSTSLGATM